MMFRWEPQMVRFMRDASEYGSYYSELAERISRHLPDDAHVCDAGCGLGYLSRELSAFCRHVSAVDIAPQALEVLRKNAQPSDRGNISIIEGDVARCQPKVPYDAMVFCFFGKTDEILRIAKKQCSGRVVIITRNWDKHRFTLTDKPIEHSLLTTADLRALGARFKSETFALEMGQPFRTLEDAVDFFRIYSRDQAAQSITEEDVSGRLTHQPSGEFPYYLPSLKVMRMIVLDAREIPAHIDINK